MIAVWLALLVLTIVAAVVVRYVYQDRYRDNEPPPPEDNP